MKNVAKLILLSQMVFLGVFHEVSAAEIIQVLEYQKEFDQPSLWEHIPEDLQVINEFRKEAYENLKSMCEEASAEENGSSFRLDIMDLRGGTGGGHTRYMRGMCIIETSN